MVAVRRLIGITVFLLPAFAGEAQVVFTTLHSFQVFTNGQSPQAAMVQGSDGYFYGTTTAGGTNGGNGSVFKISTNGALTSLYSFTGGDDGATPYSLVQGSNSYFYGVAFGAGTNSDGSVFKISTNGALTSLYSFAGNDGANPLALVQGRDGYLYGATSGGGTNGGKGTIFKISTNGALTSLHSFSGGSDGGGTGISLAQGSDGFFYGTTSSGGTNGGNGTVFKISTNGALTSLYSFTGGIDGHGPLSMVLGSDGYFYGTTSGGGTNGNGTVFKISTNGALSSLYSFTNGTDGYAPLAGLAAGSGGYLYGTTFFGGTNGGGTVFKITTNGALTGLYSFTGGSDGGNPEAAMAPGTDGKLYGTTAQGGVNGGYGTVFKITTNGALTSLYSFTDGFEGANPQAALLAGSDGNLYGTATDGGTNSDGSVFKITTNGVLTSLSSFKGSDGGAPRAVLAQASDGYLYGTTAYGGTNSQGTVFKVSTNGALASLYSFTGGNDGGHPQAGMVQGSDGYLYGMTTYGGTNGVGAVFKISTNGTLSRLYSFTNGSDGANPQAGLVRGSDGNFYGTTASGGTSGKGTVFKISTNGTLASLYSFTGGNDGANPYAGLVQGSDGKLYGTTEFGGTNSQGTVFKISTNGAFNSLYSFTGGNDGGLPEAGLVQGSDGNFYGTAFNGGTYGSGAVFKISANGALTSLYSFTGGNDGEEPQAGLVQGSDGAFYGTTAYGGSGGNGTVFRLSTGTVPVGGSLQVTITPATVVSAGAQWQVDGGAPQASGATVNNLSAGSHTLSFTPVAGFITPTNQTVSITNGATTSATGVYTLPAVFNSITRSGPGTFQLTATGTSNQVYNVLATTNVALPASQWWTIGTATANSSGVINFTDFTATNALRFYLLSQ